jgi:hypothetical protein
MARTPLPISTFYTPSGAPLSGGYVLLSLNTDSSIMPAGLEQDFTAAYQPNTSSFYKVLATPTGMMGASVPGDVFSEFVVSQPDAKLFLSFYDSSLALLLSVDLSTVGDSVTSPASTAFFIVTCNGATPGGTYAFTYSINADTGYSYVIYQDSDGSNYDTAFSSAHSDTAVECFPFGSTISGSVIAVTAQDGDVNPFHINFYSSGRALLSTAPADIGSYIAPELTSFFSLTVDDTIPINDGSSIVITVSAASLGQICGGMETRIDLDVNGSVIGSPLVWPNAELRPLGSCYNLESYASNGELVSSTSFTV